MSNSKLVNYTKLSPNHSGTRTHSIDRITPHCVVGQCSVETLGNIFMNKKVKQAVTTASVQTAGFSSVLMRTTVRGVLLQTQTTREPLQLNVQASLNTLTHLTIKFIISWLSFALTSASVTARKSFCGLTIKTRL